MTSADRTIADLVFAGFNRRVVALDRYTGEVAWDWRAPRGTGFASILVDGDRLVVGVNGYVYCLDPLYGQEVWSNPMKGYGTGITCLASLHGATQSGPGATAAAAEAARQQQAASAAATNAATVG